MSSNWSIKKLGDVINLKRGYDLPSKDRIEGTVPIMSSSGINGYHNEVKVKGPGVVTGRSGQLGKVFYIEDDYWALNTTLYVEDFKNNYPKFIYYLLQTLDFGQFNAGSSVPTLNRNHVHLLDVYVPDYQTQCKIGDILYDFEQKIFINQQTISLLEELSQTLFKHWFIDFEFPNEEGQPYKSSGGKMVDSELGEIPEGWKAGTLGDICLLSNEKIKLDASEKAHHYIGLEHMPQGNIALGNWESSEKVSGIKGVFNKGDILFGKLRPYFKKVGIAAIDGVCSTDILVVRPKNKHEKAYLLVNLIQDKFIEYTTSTATGTRMPRTGWNQISRYSVVIPSDDLLRNFNGVIHPMLEQIQELIHENIYLAKTLDTLLPKLLSGEIEISDEVVMD